MGTSFLEKFLQNHILKITVAIYGVLSLWWITIFLRGLTEGPENDYFTLSYAILPLLGGVAGWIYAGKWGGFKSTLGSAIAFLSLGLLAQFVGQIFYSYYIFVLGVEVPYPSLGDVVYFSSVIFYILGAISLAKVSGVKLSLGTITGKVQAILIPVGMLLISYVLLLKDYEYDFSSPAIVFLDFGFPVGQVIFLSIAIINLLISKNILGGMMRKPMMLLVWALIFQFISDFAFSYQYSYGEIYAGDFLDFLYNTSYFLMAIALVYIGNMFYKVKDS